ncbi:FG-GAP-like repeat-containing protein [Alteromonas halophila]|uniref:ASPIC/UnbV domain-containing protein n=1 Tax=Alteromonas halophila TaxID=516698 RepID=A0A918N140_9ALTE|nr:FG-GAP-like repeat-containing protein [Alteromonas halophila]GGW96853.1 hypothetical protein GCM10007391_33660 [Alteromonas halophila]
MDIVILGGSGFTRDYGKKAWWHTVVGNHILQNNQGHYLMPEAGDSGIDQHFSATACAIADLDNDRDQDIVLTGPDGVQLYRNDGTGHFDQVALPSGLDLSAWTTHAAIADFNQDGLADIYLSRFIDYNKGARTFETLSGYKSVTDVDFQPAFYDAVPNLLLVNQGNLAFSAHPFSDDINDAAGRTLSSQWHDFNDDGWLDLLVLNGFGSPAQVYLNEQGRTFKVAEQALRKLHITDSRAVLIDHFSDAERPSYLFSRPRAQRSISLSYQHSQLRDTTYQDGFDKPNLHFDNWGMTTGDWDNDGDLDVYVSSGGAMPDADAPNISQAQSDLVFSNQHNTHFSAMQTVSMALPSHSGRTALRVDLDNDGQLEVLQGNNNDGFRLLKSVPQTAGNWLGLVPEKPLSWIDATITVELPDRVIYRRFSGQAGLFGTDDGRLHIGLGKAQSVNNIAITTKQKTVNLGAVEINRYHRVDLMNGTTQRADIAAGEDPLMQLVDSSDQRSLIEIASILQKNNDLASYYIDRIWQRASPDTRLTLLARLTPANTPQTSTLLFHALASSSRSLILSALHHLKQREMESSIARITPLLASDDPEIVCATAGMLAHFYEQEEAVIHRKYLAVAPLLHALNDTAAPQAQLCIMNALAHAEHQRAVPFLLAKLARTTDEDIQTGLIRALGMIRSATATGQLVATLPHLSGGRAKAAALIALERLSYADVSLLAQRYIPEHYDNTIDAEVLHRQLNLFSYLFTESDGLVIAKYKVKQRFSTLAETILATRNEPLIAAMLTIAGRSQDNHLLPVVTQVPETLSDTIRLKRLGIALTLASPAQRPDYEAELLAWNAPARLSLLKAFPHSLPLSRATVQALAQAWARDANDSEELVRAVSLLKAEYRPLAVAHLLDRNLVPLAAPLFNALTHAGIPYTNRMQSALDNTPDDAHIALLRWIYADTVDALSASSRIKVRMIFNQLMNSESQSWASKQALLQLAASREMSIAEQFIPLYAENLKGSDIVDMLLALPTPLASDSLRAIQSEVFNDTGNSRYTRLKAAQLMELPDHQLLSLMGDNT